MCTHASTFRENWERYRHAMQGRASVVAKKEAGRLPENRGAARDWRDADPDGYWNETLTEPSRSYRAL